MDWATALVEVHVRPGPQLVGRRQHARIAIVMKGSGRLAMFLPSANSAWLQHDSVIQGRSCRPARPAPGV